MISTKPPAILITRQALLQVYRLGYMAACAALTRRGHGDLAQELQRAAGISDEDMSAVLRVTWGSKRTRRE